MNKLKTVGILQFLEILPYESRGPVPVRIVTALFCILRDSEIDTELTQKEKTNLLE